MNELTQAKELCATYLRLRSNVRFCYFMDFIVVSGVLTLLATVLWRALAEWKRTYFILCVLVSVEVKLDVTSR